MAQYWVTLILRESADHPFSSWLLDYIGTLTVTVPAGDGDRAKVGLVPLWRLGQHSDNFNIHAVGCGPTTTDLIWREDLSQDGWCELRPDNSDTYASDDMLIDHRFGLRLQSRGRHGLMLFELVGLPENRLEVRADLGHEAASLEFTCVLRAIADRWTESKRGVDELCARLAGRASHMVWENVLTDRWFRAEVFRAVYGRALAVLETYCTGDLLVRSDGIDMLYVSLLDRLGEILAVGGMEELVPLPDTLPRSLHSLGPDDADIYMEHVLSEHLWPYKGEIHRFCAGVARESMDVISVDEAAHCLGEEPDTLRQRLGDEHLTAVSYPTVARLSAEKWMVDVDQAIQEYRQQKERATGRWWSVVEQRLANLRPELPERPDPTYEPDPDWDMEMVPAHPLEDLFGIVPHGSDRARESGEGDLSDMPARGRLAGTARQLGRHGDTMSRVREVRDLMAREHISKTEACRRVGTDTRTYNTYAPDITDWEEDDLD